MYLERELAERVSSSSRSSRSSLRTRHLSLIACVKYRMSSSLILLVFSLSSLTICSASSVRISNMISISSFSDHTGQLAFRLLLSTSFKRNLTDADCWSAWVVGCLFPPAWLAVVEVAVLSRRTSSFSPLLSMNHEWLRSSRTDGRCDRFERMHRSMSSRRSSLSTR